MTVNNNFNTRLNRLSGVGLGTDIFHITIRNRTFCDLEGSSSAVFIDSTVFRSVTADKVDFHRSGAGI